MITHLLPPALLRRRAGGKGKKKKFNYKKVTTLNQDWTER